jgi:hypothetical protein
MAFCGFAEYIGKQSAQSKVVLESSSTTGVAEDEPKSSEISYSPWYLWKLENFIPSPEVLKTKGHVLAPLSESELEGKKKCVGCDKGKNE